MPTSLDEFYPFDSGAGAGIATEAKWRAMFRHVIGSGPIIDEDDEMETVGDSTGMQVKTKAGKAWMRGHYGENQTEKTLTIATAHATLPRIDRVVLRADFTNNRIELDVLTGTAAGSPVAPSVTQSSSMWEISLATVAVGAAVSTITAGNVTDTRTLVIGAQTVTSAHPYTPVIGGTGWALGNGVISGSYVDIGDFVHARVKITFGSTTTFGTGGLTVSLPVNSDNGGDVGAGHLQDANSPAEQRGLLALIGTSTALILASDTIAGTGDRYGEVTSSVPFTLATSDVISLSLMYQKA